MYMKNDTWSTFFSLVAIHVKLCPGKIFQTFVEQGRLSLTSPSWMSKGPNTWHYAEHSAAVSVATTSNVDRKPWEAPLATV